MITYEKLKGLDFVKLKDTRELSGPLKKIEVSVCMYRKPKINSDLCTHLLLFKVMHVVQ